ncbi:MAG: UDP-N-acetylmuramoyl-tripeptide--D-alanyl-D-alanine ligase [Clostridia bacterium]|nr:UDP-N-acetylmuramoyl-tripeptide--D-alanyl-D-alanine ligase [Clostridia bacterium]
MKNLTVEDIVKVTNGKLEVGKKETVCESFCIDTRKIQNGDIHVGIINEGKNGGEYYKDAFEKGAIGCIIQEIEITEEDKEKYSDKFIVKVEDTLKALQQIAEYKRSFYDIPVIAVTGSVGKTSTKDMVASVVAQKYKTLKTEGNYNNHMGVPLTILNLKDHEAMVVEMGMNHLGEISVLTKIAKPTIAIITNVGTAHIGILGSRENILKAKLEILEGLQDNGRFIINNDNDMLNKWYIENKLENTITFGIENKSDIMAENIIDKEDGSTYTLKGLNEKIEVPVGGRHFVLNSLCSIAVGKILNIPMNDIKRGIETFELTKKRMDVSKISRNITIINDCYNANYDSMKAAIEYLGKIKDNRKIAVLGDMLELGEFSKELHEKVGEEVVKNNIDILVVVGKEAKYIKQKAIEQGFNIDKIVECDTNEEAAKNLCNIMKENDYILFKASNGMHFDEIINKIN